MDRKQLERFKEKRNQHKRHHTKAGQNRSGGSRVSPPREHSRVGHGGEGGLSVPQKSMTMDPPGEHRDSERSEFVPEWRKDTEMLTGD